MPRTWTEPPRPSASTFFVALLAAWVAAGTVRGQDEEEPPPAVGARVTVGDLLNEMSDLDALTRRPDPAYRLVAFGSASRRAAGEEPFLRVEKRGRRRERVLAELEGPGALVRLWMSDLVGTLRVYLDGDALPALEVESVIALGGEFTLFRAPLSGRAHTGGFLRFPIPFASGMKLTCDAGGFEYQVECRAYEKKTTVESFATLPAAIATFECAASLAALREAQTAPPDPNELRSSIVLPPAPYTVDLAPGDERVLVEAEVESPEAITSIVFEELGRFLAPTSLEAIRLELDFDGRRTVSCPLGAFFASPADFVPFRTYPVACDLRLQKVMRRRVSRFVMPYRKSVRAALVNRGTAAVSNLRFALERRPYAWDGRSLRFHARPVPGEAEASAEAEYGVLVGVCRRTGEEPLSPRLLHLHGVGAGGEVRTHQTLFETASGAALARFRLLDRRPFEGAPRLAAGTTGAAFYYAP